MISSKHNYLSKASPPNTVIRELGLQYINGRVGNTIQSFAVCDNMIELKKKSDNLQYKVVKLNLPMW